MSQQPIPVKGRRYRGVSEEVRRAERRQRFVEAGLDVFASRGYHQSTVRSICASARLTERYFYESFSNSEDLLCAVYEYTVQRVREHTLAALLMAAPSPEQLIERSLHAFFGVLQQDPRLARMLFVEVLGVSERIDALYRQTVEDFALLFVQISQQIGYELDRLPGDVRPELVTIGLVGAVINVAARWLVMDFQTPVEQLVASLRHIFMSVLAPGSER